MDRREFISESSKKLTVFTFGSGLLFLYRCSTDENTAFNANFSTEEVRIINELGDIIIPSTDTPGAKAAEVGEFIALIVQDCYSEEDRVNFKRHLNGIDKFSKEIYGRRFLGCTDKERKDLVSQMEKDHDGYKSIKGLIVSAYLSSEIGMTQFFDYYPVPGRYDGCTENRPW